MRRNRYRKLTPAIAGLLTGLFFAILTLHLHAQFSGDSRQSYDVTQEVTLSGTVSGVLIRPAPGMIWGSHLLLTTVSGTVDASLGRWGLQEEGALSVTVGQQVELTGIMKTLNSRAVFLARTVKLNGQVYTMRNEHGIPVPSPAGAHAAQKGKLQ
jgi:hypothetical protein